MAAINVLRNAFDCTSFRGYSVSVSHRFAIFPFHLTIYSRAAINTIISSRITFHTLLSDLQSPCHTHVWRTVMMVDAHGHSQRFPRVLSIFHLHDRFSGLYIRVTPKRYLGWYKCSILCRAQNLTKMVILTKGWCSNFPYSHHRHPYNITHRCWHLMLTFVLVGMCYYWK